MERVWWVGGVLGLFTGVLGCGEQQVRSDPWEGTMRDSAGVRIVESGSVGIWGAEPRVTFEELSLGRLDGDGPEAFGNVVGLDVDAAGYLFVLDAFAHEVRIFDAEGRHVGSLGGAGAGPGELSRNSVGVFVGPDGTVMVPDLGNARVTVFGQGGSPAPSWPIRFEHGIPLRWDATEDGTLMAQLRSASAFTSAGGAPEGVSGDPIVRYAADGSVVDTLALLPAGGSVTVGGAGAPDIRLFESEPVWDAGRDGTVAWGMNDEYDIALQAGGGAPHRRLRRAAERRSVTPGDEAALRRMMRGLMIDQGAPPPLVDGILERMTVAPSYPAIAGVQLTRGGEVWVQRVLVPADMAEADRASFDPQDLGSHEWDVFDGEGRYLGVLSFPRRFTLMRVHDDRVYGVVRDDMGVQRVVRLRIG